MRITVIVTPEEYAQIKRKAGLVPLSAWIRSLALDPVKDVPRTTEVHVVERSADSNPVAKTCKHGLMFCKTCK